MDKVVIITGASRGVGRATALAFAKSGAKVVLASRTENELISLAEQIEKSGGSAMAIPTDVTSLSQVENLVAKTIENFSRIDILVNNAGIGIFESIVDSDPMKWTSVIGSNLKSLYLCSREVLKHMLDRESGQIINILSIASKTPFKGASAYCAAKAGALAFTKVLSEEVRDKGIRVTAILPGSIHSSFWDSMEFHPDFDQMLKPEQVAETILKVSTASKNMVFDELTITPQLGIL